MDDIDKLILDLGNASRDIQGAAFSVTKRHALGVKNLAVQFASGIGHAPHYPRSITFDMDLPSLTSVGADIGPDKDRRQGALGNILEYGTSKNAPIKHLGPALDRIGPDWVEDLASSAADLL